MPPEPRAWLADFRVDRAVLAVFLAGTIGLGNAPPGGGKALQGWCVPAPPRSYSAAFGVKRMESHASSAIARKAPDVGGRNGAVPTCGARPAGNAVLHDVVHLL